MTTVYTQYNDAVTYEAVIPYDGIYVTADTTPTTGNRHSAIWRPQHGRSHIHRATPSLPAFSGVHHRTLPKPPTPEITVSKAIQEVILAPSPDAAQAEILDFVRNKEERREAQPELPAEKVPVLMAAPPLAAEVGGQLAAHRERQRVANRRRDDAEVLELVSLMGGF